MESFRHINSAVEPPTLNAITANLADTLKQDFSDLTIEEMHIAVERIACERAAARIGSAASCVDRVCGDLRYIESSVFIEFDDTYCGVDSEAANRIADRIHSGLSLSEACKRTLAQCNAPVMSAQQLAELEREAVIQQRRQDKIDKVYLANYDGGRC